MLCALLAALSAPLSAHTFKASAVEGQASIADGLAQVSFKIAIANDGSSPMTNVVVVFADNTEVSVGDVAGEATVTSDTQSRTIEVGEGGTRSVVMQVTLKYQVDGENIETPWILSVVAE
jgi:hypothetical protein